MIITGKFIPQFVLNKNQWYFYVGYCDDTLRPLFNNQRFIFTASNGWKIINGFTAPPKILLEQKCVFGVSHDDRFDNVGTLIEGNLIGVTIIINEIKKACEESCIGEWNENRI